MQLHYGCASGLRPARCVDGIGGQAYKSPMEWGRIRRTAIALSAAYAVALQALFLSFIPVATATLTDPALVLCSYRDGDGSGHPAQHQSPCVAICAAMGHGIGGVLPLLVVDALAPTLVAAVAELLGSWVVPALVEIRPQTSRGPPIG